MTRTLLDIVITWVLCLICFGIGGCTGENEGIKDTTIIMRQEAKEAGAGEFYLDHNDEKQFRWVNNDKKETRN